MIRYRGTRQGGGFVHTADTVLADAPFCWGVGGRAGYGRLGHRLGAPGGERRM